MICSPSHRNIFIYCIEPFVEWSFVEPFVEHLRKSFHGLTYEKYNPFFFSYACPWLTILHEITFIAGVTFRLPLHWIGVQNRVIFLFSGTDTPRMVRGVGMSPAAAIPPPPFIYAYGSI